MIALWWEFYSLSTQNWETTHRSYNTLVDHDKSGPHSDAYSMLPHERIVTPEVSPFKHHVVSSHDEIQSHLWISKPCEMLPYLLLVMLWDQACVMVKRQQEAMGKHKFSVKKFLTLSLECMRIFYGNLKLHKTQRKFYSSTKTQPRWRAHAASYCRRASTTPIVPFITKS